MRKRISGRAIIIKDGFVYLMFRRKKVNGEVREYYAVPGGGMEKDETIEECTKREIMEEFNLNVEVKDFLGIVEDEKNIGFVYKADIISGEFKLGGEELEGNNEDNYYEVRKVSLRDIDNIELLEENRKLIRKAMEL